MLAAGAARPCYRDELIAVDVPLVCPECGQRLGADNGVVCTGKICQNARSLARCRTRRRVRMCTCS